MHSPLLTILRDRQRLINKATTFALIGSLVAANVILYGLLFVNAAAENWHQTIISNQEP